MVKTGGFAPKVGFLPWAEGNIMCVYTCCEESLSRRSREAHSLRNDCLEVKVWAVCLLPVVPPPLPRAADSRIPSVKAVLSSAKCSQKKQHFL